MQRYSIGVYKGGTLVHAYVTDSMDDDGIVPAVRSAAEGGE
jgi:hypothetical protein